MKLAVLSFLCILALSCKEIKKEVKPTETLSVTTVDPNRSTINSIFEAHGGLQNWKNKRTLSFTIPKKNAVERHTIDLYSRNGKIETTEFAMGFDGADFWLLDEEENYKGDPVFYHNLMFYFYSMPFVLADNGVQYSKTESLLFEGSSYPGIRITYDAGVGISAKDEYFIHYNPETFQMEWLGYTVTYRSGEKSDNVKWIRYNDWMSIEGLLLPKSITWYDYEGRTIKDARKPVRFDNVALSDVANTIDFYAKPENAKIVIQKKP